MLKYVCFQFVYIAQFSLVKKSWIEWFSAIFGSQQMVIGSGLIPKHFYNLLMYTNNFCFGYITVSCFFETFPDGWGGLMENLILMKTTSSAWTLTLTLDLDLGFVKIDVVPLYIHVL